MLQGRSGAEGDKACLEADGVGPDQSHILRETPAQGRGCGTKNDTKAREAGREVVLGRD